MPTPNHDRTSRTRPAGLDYPVFRAGPSPSGLPAGSCRDRELRCSCDMDCTLPAGIRRAQSGTAADAATAKNPQLIEGDGVRATHDDEVCAEPADMRPGSIPLPPGHQRADSALADGPGDRRTRSLSASGHRRVGTRSMAGTSKVCQRPIWRACQPRAYEPSRPDAVQVQGTGDRVSQNIQDTPAGRQRWR